MSSTVHQTWGNFFSRKIGCLPARPLASALRRLECLIRSPFIGRFSGESAAFQRVRWPRPYARLAPLYREIFLLRQIPSCFPAGPWIYTGLSCSAWAPVFLSILPWKCSLYPVKGSRTSPQMFCPMSKSLSGKREGFQDNAIHKKGSLLLTRIRAPAARPTQWCRVREPWAEGVAQIYKVCISG